MRILAVPNWSLGRNNTVLRQLRDGLEALPIEIHYLAGDVDHNRSVLAVSGEREEVKAALHLAADHMLPAIDLNRHAGCHPRIGALDVCPFIPYEQPEDPEEFNRWIHGFCEELAEKWSLPVFLYEKSAPAGRPSSLPHLRREGFGGLLARELDSDFGPRKANPLLGASVVGWRDFLVALNVNLRQPEPYAAQTLAQKIRIRRKDDPMFAGIRALGFALSARGMSQLSMNFTKPSLTPIDPVIRWAGAGAENIGTSVADTELIGVIRPRDMEHCTLVPVAHSQVVDIR